MIYLKILIRFAELFKCFNALTRSDRIKIVRIKILLRDIPQFYLQYRQSFVTRIFFNVRRKTLSSSISCFYSTIPIDAYIYRPMNLQAIGKLISNFRQSKRRYIQPNERTVS